MIEDKDLEKIMDVTDNKARACPTDPSEENICDSCA